MKEETLFELPAIEEKRAAAPTSPGEARVLRPVRNQPEWAVLDLEQEHRARYMELFGEFEPGIYRRRWLGHGGQTDQLSHV